MRQVRGKWAEHKLYYILLSWNATGGLMDAVYYSVNTEVDFSFKGESGEMCF